MKKLPLLLLFLALFLTGCEKNTSQIATADVYNVTNGVTNDGVKVGDGKDAFKAAYNNYIIQVAHTDTAYSSYTVTPMKKIPFDEPISTLIATFFIDNQPLAEEEICSENDIEEEELLDLLSSPSYLQAHEVIYRYLRFNWEDGLITDIDSSELNYNESYEVPMLE